MIAPLASVAERAAKLHSVGVAASDNGQPATAVRALRAGLRLVDRARANDEPGLAEIGGRLLISLAWAESERGRVDRGFQLLDVAEAHIPASQLPILLAQRALLLKRNGRNDLALQQYDAAVALLDGRADPLDLVKALNNRSLVHLEAGHVRLARADLHRCGQIAERHGLRLHAVLSRVNLGCLDVLAGDLPSALGAFAAARSEYAALAPGRLPALAVERARALVAAGLYAEADRELGYATEQAVAQRLSHTYADALQVRAEAALLADRPEAAVLWAGEARSGFLGRVNARGAACASLWELRARFATSGEDVGKPAEALSARLHRLGLPEDARVAGLLAARCALRTGGSRRAQRIIARVGPPGRVDRLDTRLLWRLTQAELAGAERRAAAASRHLRAGMSTLHRYRTQFGSLDLQTGATVHGRDLARAALAGAIATGQPGEIFRWSERVRAQALLLSPVRPPPDPDVAAALEELRQTRYSLRAAEVVGRPTGSLRTRIETLQRIVREHAWSTPGRPVAIAPASASLAATRQALGASALVIYLTDGPALLALVIVDGVATLVPLGRFQLVAEAVHRLRADLDVRAGRALPSRLAASVAAATQRDAESVATAVLDPLRPRLGDRDLVIVPTGILVTVPWPILPGCAGRAVTVAPSATAWLTARDRLRRAVPADGSILVVAGPGNDRSAAEVAAIAALYPDSTVLTGEDATPAATLAAFGTAGVAHLATHGHHQAENALFSTLELAGGPLFGYDLQHVEHGLSMVVLSSCELGLTDVRPGDEGLGMVSALLGAGAATVIASVTRVADDTTMAAMVRYHRSIASGTAPAAALAAALASDPTTAFVCFGAG